jgi:tape measure domain-containing protein
MSTLAQLNVKIGAQVEGFQKAIKSIERDLGRFQRTFETIGRNLTQSVSLPLAALGAASVRAFGEFEGLEKAFIAVAAEGTNVGQEIERLRKIAEAPGLGFNEAVKASTRLQAVGLSAGEAARVIEQYGNAVARSGGGREQFDGAILALTQVASKGKISAEEINQLNERIFEIRPALKAAFGTSDSEELQRLGISAQEFIARTTEELAKLERVQGGLANAFENFGDTARQALTDIGREVANAINLSGILDKLSSALATAATFFRNLSPEAKRTAVIFGLVAIAIGPVLLGVAKLVSLFTLALQGAKALIGGVKALAGVVAFLASPVGLVVAGLTALTAAAIFLYNRFELVRKIANGLIDGFKALGDLAKTVAGNIAQGFVDLLRGNFKDALGAFKDAFTSSSLVSVGKSFAEGFGDGFEDSSNRINTTIDGIRTKLKALATPTGPTGGAFGTTPFSTDALERTPKGKAGVTGIADEKTISLSDRMLDSLRGISGILPSIRSGFDAAQDRVKKFVGAANELDVRTSTYRDIREELPQIATGFENATVKNRTFAKSLQELGATAPPIIEGVFTSFQIGAAQAAATLNEFNDAINQLIEQGLENLAVSVGDAFGEILSGAAKGNSLIGAVLIPIAEALEQLGKLAIATGISIKGIKVALESLNPIAAIAGGIALIALSKFVKARAASLAKPPKLAAGGLATGPTLAVVGDNRNARVDPEVIAPLSKLKGMLGGEGFIAEARISGDDLLLLVSRADQRLNLLR